MAQKPTHTRPNFFPETIVPGVFSGKPSRSFLRPATGPRRYEGMGNNAPIKLAAQSFA